MKTKAHTQYRLSDGTYVPGITTLTNQLAKPALIQWANRIGLLGHDVNKYRDEKAQTGDLVHKMILADLKDEVLNTDDWSKNQITAAENSFRSWTEWKARHVLKPMCIETPLVSEWLRAGGTPDYIGYIDGRLCVGDYKTGAIYTEAIIQTCGYRLLWEEQNPAYSVEEIIILGIPRTPDENFEEKHIRDFIAATEIIQDLAKLYWDMKILRSR